MSFEEIAVGVTDRYAMMAHEQALKSFINKDIVLAESVRQMRDRVQTLSVGIEKVAARISPWRLCLKLWRQQLF